MIDVLVVDDNQDIADCLETLLTLAGYRVRLAADGKAGLAALGDRLPDVVILDVEMPGLDGPGMAHQMMVDDCGSESIPIVLTSAMERLREIAVRMGTPYYLAKPYDVSTLLSLVTRAVKERIAPCPPTPAGVPPCKLE